jgi:hypothetical protein
MSGDVALFNNQTPPAEGQKSDIRLSGFSCGVSPTGFCVALGGFQQEVVVMVVHQTVGVQLPVEPIDDRGQDSQEALPVLVIEVDYLPAPPWEATWCRAPRNSMRRGLAI